MAQNVMGDKFDIKKFNDYLLEDGTLALNIMDEKCISGLMIINRVGSIAVLYIVNRIHSENNTSNRFT
jgi:hypothetical protein